MSLNQIIDKNRSAPLVCDSTLNLKAENIRVEGDVSAATFNGSSFIPVPPGGAVNNVLVKTISSAAWTDTLDIQKINFSGSPAGEYLDYYSTFSLPYSAKSWDGVVYRNANPPVLGFIEFTRIGNVVTAFLPRFEILAFSGGGATQQIWLLLDTPLPAELRPVAPFVNLTIVESGSADVLGFAAYTPAPPGGLSAGAGFYLSSAASPTGCTVSCGLPYNVYMQYSIS